MTQIIFTLLLSFAIAYLILWIFPQIPYEKIEWLQTYAPAWIPRKILFGCLPCTSFWITFILTFWMYFIDPQFLYIPFIVPGMVKFFEDILL